MALVERIAFGVVTVSDTCSADATKDRSGPRLVGLIAQHFPAITVKQSCVPDERELIEQELRALSAQAEMALVITTGGTGFAGRDVTPEATKAVIDKECAQLANYVYQASMQKTKFAALSRGVFGIRARTLILNFPGSVKAVSECFEIVRELLPHALGLIRGNDEIAKSLGGLAYSHGHGSHGHACLSAAGGHRCGGDGPSGSPYAMIPVTSAQDLIFKFIGRDEAAHAALLNLLAPVNIPPFRASIKDGYAMTSTGFAGAKRVLGHISAGDKPLVIEIKDDECYKISTGAPVPSGADCVVQVEDTKVLTRDAKGGESLVEILVSPEPNLDIRPIGSDLQLGSKLFPTYECSPVVLRSLLASVGSANIALPMSKIGIVSTGAELLQQDTCTAEGKVYDSNTTMLKELLRYFGFHTAKELVLDDDLQHVTKNLSELFCTVDIVISSGGVSMGDKDYIKSALKRLEFNLHFGRVDMKPGKPTCFASRGSKYYFGLPGNPVSTFVTFHLFALPGIRWANGWKRSKCTLPQVVVKLEGAESPLDSRPEYARATVTSRGGSLFARIQGNQISSRLQSIVGADVLLHLPARTATKTHAKPGEEYNAFILRYDFITNYE